MKIGISTASLFLKYLTEDALFTLKNIGAENAEVFLSTFSEYEESFVSDLAENNPGVNVHSIHVLSTQFEPQLFSNHKRVRTDAEYLLRKVCRAAQILGARNYTFHGPLKLKKSPLNIDMSRFAERVNELTDIAEEYGITVCYENIHYGFFSEPEFFAGLKTECPKLGMCFDIKHAAFSGIHPLEFLDAGGDRIKTVHVVDLVGEDTRLPAPGGYDFGGLLKSIAAKGLDPAVMIEAYAKNYTNIDELKKSYDYLLNIFMEEVK